LFDITAVTWKNVLSCEKLSKQKCVGEEEDSEMYLNVITKIYFKGDEKNEKK
jgi:hypothetical protein